MQHRQWETSRTNRGQRKEAAVRGMPALPPAGSLCLSAPHSAYSWRFGISEPSLCCRDLLPEKLQGPRAAQPSWSVGKALQSDGGIPPGDRFVSVEKSQVKALKIFSESKIEYEQGTGEGD